MHLFHLDIIWEHLILLHRQTQKNITSVVTTKLINLSWKNEFFFHNINCIPWGRHSPGSMKPTKKMRQKVTLWVQRIQNNGQRDAEKITSSAATPTSHRVSFAFWAETNFQHFAPATRESFSLPGKNGMCYYAAWLGWVVGWLGSSGGKWWWETARHPWVTLLFELTYPFPKPALLSPWFSDFSVWEHLVTTMEGKVGPQNPDGFRFNRHIISASKVVGKELYLYIKSGFV